MKYKVGDILRVRKDLKRNATYYNEDDHYGNIAVRSMTKFAGKEVLVTAIIAGQYIIEGSICYWTDGMFEGYAFQEEELNADADQLLGLLM